MSKISTRDASTISTMLSTEEYFDTGGPLSGRNVGRDYVVYSYAEPILKITGDRVEITTRKFSVTTSRHQSTIRRAVSLAGLDDYVTEVDQITFN